MGRTLLVATVAMLVVGCGNSLECGNGTVEQNGECVPGATTNNTTTGTNNVTTGEVTCGVGTELNAEDECIVSEPTTCGRGTQLEANSGECVVTAEVCAPGTAFNGATKRCEPTSDVCADGTTFNVMMGVCMADSQCQPGDTLTNGVCLSSLEAKIANADLHEAENNDPSLGGTPDEVTLPNVGFSVVMSASVGAPADLDGDMVEDQDVDVFTFDATEGQIVQVSLEQSPGPELSYVVEGPNGYARFSGESVDVALTRGFVITETGQYTLTVEPVPGLPTFGGDQYLYALTFETFDVPAGEPTDLTMLTMVSAAESRFPTVLTDSMNFAAGELALVEVNPGLDVEVIGWDGQQITTTAPGGFSVPFEVPASGEVTLILDVVRPEPFDVSARPGGPVSDLGVVAAGTTLTESRATFDSSDGSSFFQVEVPAGAVLELSQTNDQDEVVEFVVQGEFDSAASLNDPLAFGPRYAYGPIDLAGGSYLIEVSSFAMLTNLELMFTAVVPTDEGNLVDGATVSLSEPNPIASGKRYFFTADLASELVLSGELQSGGDMDIAAYAAGLDVLRAATVGDESFTWIAEPASYLFELRMFGGSSTGYTFEMGASTFAPVDEIEPNDTLATASSGLADGEFVRGQAEGVATDWYSIDIASTGVLQLAMQLDGAFADLSLRNDLGETLASGFERADAVVEPGTYYAVVERDEAGAPDTEYLLNMTLSPITADLLDAGANDDSANAQVTTLGPAYTIVGTVVSSTDQDWYRFDLAAATSYRVSADPRATFYDAALTPIAAVDGLVDLPAGASYVAYEGFVDGGPNDYLMNLSLPPERLETSSPAAAIPDNGAPSNVVTDTITVQGGPPCTITTAEVGVDISHTFVGDLRISLEGPNGDVVILYDGAGGSAVDLLGVFGVSLSSVDPLDVFVGQVASGDWTLTVGDAAAVDSGTLNTWSVGFNCQ